jgi:hypothetical protein
MKMENPLDDMFKFPIIMINGDEEEERLRNGESIDNPDIIIGTCEQPYYDLCGIKDAWKIGTDSHARAVQGKFDACMVTFERGGTYIVPWTRSKFKQEYYKFLKTKEDGKDTNNE